MSDELQTDHGWMHTGIGMERLALLMFIRVIRVIRG